jgi:hypothetical protein
VRAESKKGGFLVVRRKITETGSEIEMTNLDKRCHVHDAREAVARLLVEEFEAAPTPGKTSDDPLVSAEELACIQAAWVLMKELARELGLK